MFQLMQSHRGQTGQIEIPHMVRKRKDLGFWADMIVGAVAATAALWAFPPETKPVTTAGLDSTIIQFDLVKVIGLSLIIGSAGSSFLSSFQAKALALVKAQEARTTTKVAHDQIDRIEHSVKTGAAKEHILGQLGSAKAAVAAVGTSGPGNPDFE